MMNQGTFVVEGKRAVVTGAGRGLGRALAYELNRAGCLVALLDIDGPAVAETQATLPLPEIQSWTYTVDVSDLPSMERFVDALREDCGKIDILINNAGLTVGALFTEHSPEDWRRVIDVNLMGVVHATRLLLPDLMVGEDTRIINISSVFGLVAVPWSTAYCASKFALTGLTEALRHELAGSRVHIIAIHPGGVNTGIVDAMKSSDSALKEHMSRMFRERTMSPERVAKRIVLAMIRKEKRVLISAETKLAVLFRRIFPVGFEDFLRRSFLQKIGLPLQDERFLLK